MKKYILIFAISAVFTACEQEEIPVINEPGETPGVITNQLEMGDDYQTQMFYDLGTNSVVGQNLKTSWDLGFEASPSGWRVVLNTANGGAVANTEISDFESVTSASGWEWKNEVNSGNLDSTAFGDYRETLNVYIVDRGFDVEGNSLGFFKIVIESVDESNYTIRAANLDGSNEQTLSIPKNDELNFVAYSFELGSVVSVEPPKDSWDILFSQYTFVFIDPPTAYIVTGALINRNGVEVAVDYSTPFENIDLEFANSLEYTNNIDVIGYEWKFFDFTAAIYLVDSDINYIIKDTEGRIFKLHFTDFYNQNGEKGAPEFEVQELL